LHRLEFMFSQKLVSIEFFFFFFEKRLITYFH
jgi:hypothetical protein